MPGLPLPTRENTSSARHGSSVHLSAEDAIAAEESLSQYCKPVELYNVLQRRSLRKPLILQRCLQYKIEARRQRRIQMNISLSETLNTGEQVQDILPLYVLLAKPNPYNATGGHSAVYIIKQACVLTASREFKSRGQHLVNFILPEINELLAEANSNKLTILLLSRGERKNSLCEKNVINDHIDTSYPSNFGGYCLWGEMPLLSLDWSPTNSVNLSSAHGAEMLSTVAMQSCFLEQCSLKMGSDISFKIPDNHVTMQVQVSICVQELRAKESSAYNLYSHENIPTPELSYIMRLRYGNVLFNYKYYNNTLQKTEATEDFSCPFCLVQCASFKGLRLHLRAFHDLFCYEFWVTEDYQIVNVYLKSDTFKFETADGVDPKLEKFYFCAKPRKRRRSRNPSGNAKNVYTHVVRSETPEMAGEGFLEDLRGKEDGASSIPMPKTYTLDAGPSNKTTLQKYDNGSHYSKEMDKALKSLRANDLQKNSNVERNCTVHPSLTEGLERVASSPNVNDTCTAMAQSGVGLECFQQESGCNAMLQFAKTRKLSIERSDPRNRILLQKRQFFHSHRAQPMAVEQVLSDRDSEDEVDDDIADFEDRRMLDDFVDVTKDEKRIMHLWNSFVRKQRVLADGHIPWACEAFSRLHADDFTHSPALMWCWRLLMIKLWNHSLLDANIMDKCNKILQKIEQESSGAK